MAELNPPPLLETTIDLEKAVGAKRQTFYMKRPSITKSGGGSNSHL
jgi:hypothetical protein